MKTLTLMLLLLGLLNACGRPVAKSPARLREKISPDQMQAVMLAQSIQCAQAEGCPEGVARMFAINFNDLTNSSMCTAFLVAPDLVMTNSHCIYAGRMSQQKTCEGLYFIFPTKNFTYVQAGCSEILWKDKRTNGRRVYKKGHNDFALVRLDKTLSLTPLKILKTGMRKGDRVFPMVIDHHNVFSANILKLFCRVDHVSAKHGVATLSNCPVIKGNSGSAVLDENDNVVGILFASSHDVSNRVDIPNRRRSTSKGFAFSMDHIERKIGHLIP